jgi:hypothetical protein
LGRNADGCAVGFAVGFLYTAATIAGAGFGISSTWLAGLDLAAIADESRTKSAGSTATESEAC